MSDTDVAELPNFAIHGADSDLWLKLLGICASVLRKTQLTLAKGARILSMGWIFCLTAGRTATKPLRTMSLSPDMLDTGNAHRIQSKLHMFAVPSARTG